MRIDSARVRAERQKRAWSQQHLATVTGLGLRTVQRIEKEGTAAYDSAQALAACFELPLDEFTRNPAARQPGARPATRRSRTWLGTGAAFVAGAALMSVQWVLAEDLLVDVGFSDSTTEGAYQLQVHMTSGKPTEILLPGAQRMVITPRVLDESQLLFEVSFYQDSDEQNAGGEPTGLLQRPSLVTRVGQEARVMIGITDSRARCIALRSSLLAEPVESGAGESSVRTIEPLDSNCDVPPIAGSGVDESGPGSRQ